jgi:hypothetical protein
MTARRNPGRRVLVWGAALMLVLGSASVSSEETAPRIRSIAVRPKMAKPGTDLRVTVHIDRHPASRTLQLEIEALSFYARTDRQLDGKEAPVSHTFTWRNLPAGEYTIRATLECAEEPPVHDTRTMKVVGAPEETGIVGRP